MNGVALRGRGRPFNGDRARPGAVLAEVSPNSLIRYGCMAIAVAEIVGNIVEHGGALRRPVEIHMEFALSETGQVHIHLVDDGDELPADVDLSTVRMPDPTAERGGASRWPGPCWSS